MDDQTTINGRYRIIGALGTGAQGTVYAVEDILANKRCALKLCGAHGSGALETEFFHLLDLSHPNLAHVYDYQRIHDVHPGSDLKKGQVFFTEELIDGVHVTDYVRGLSEPRRLAAAAQIGIGVARALRMLHSRGMLHLDVKPSNIIVEPSGIPRLIDLGLARLKSNAIGVKSGTPGYVPPEIFEGIAGEGTDVFALGRVLIQLLSLTPPPLGIDETPQIPGFVPDKLRTALLRMTHSSLAQRYSARETVLAIQKCGLSGIEPHDHYLDDSSEAEDPLSRFAVARSTKFVGRDIQRDELSQLLIRTFAQPGMLLCVVSGPVGVGKTRLIRKVVASRQVFHAQAQQASITFVSGSLERVSRMVLGDMDGLVPDANGIATADRAGLPGQRPPSGHVSENRMGALLASLANHGQPIVVVVEDATASQIVIANNVLQSRAFTPPFGCVLIFEHGDVGFSREFADIAPVIHLDPLSVAEEHQMVTGITGVALTTPQMEQFHRITGGNPRFSEALVEQFFFAQNAYQLGNAPTMSEIATAPGQLVAARLLADATRVQKKILYLFSIATTPLYVDEIQKAASLDDGQTWQRFLTQLADAGYVHTDSGRTSLISYVAEGIRASMDDSRRREYHHLLFKIMREDRVPGERGRHAFHAGLLTTARQFLREAAEVAMASGDIGLAINYLEMLNQCEQVSPIEWRIQLAVCYRRAGRYSRALRVLNEILETSPTDKVLFEKAAALRLIGSVADARELLLSLKNSALDEIRAASLALLARIHLDLGEIDHGLQLVQEVVLPDAAAHDSGLLNIQGLLWLTVGQVEKAENTFLKGLAVARERNSSEEGRYHAYLGMVAHTRKNWQDAAERYATAFRLSDEFGDSHGAATSAVNWAAALTELGDFSNALIRYRNGLARLRLVGRPAELVQSEANYAQLLLRLGDARGALDVAQKALSDIDTEQSPLVRGHVLLVLGESLNAAGSSADAVPILNEADGVFIQMNQQHRRDLCQLQLATARLHEGDASEAAKRLDGICDAIVVDSLPYHMLRVLVAMAKEGNINASLVSLETQLRGKPDTLNLEYYEGAAIFAMGLYRIGDTAKCADWIRNALALLDDFRRQTPALHQPVTYPHEFSLKTLQARIAMTAGESNADGLEGVNMKQMLMERLIRIAARLNSELNLDAQLDIIMDAAVDVTGAERGFLLIRDDNGAFVIRSARNMDAEALLKEEQHYSGNIAQRAFETGEPIVTTNAQEDERYRDYRSVAMLNLMYIVAIPLLEKGKAQGTIYLDSTSRGHFDGERIEILKMLANQAAIAMTNARLMAHVQRSNAQVEKLNRKLENRLESTERELAQTKQDLREINESLATRYSYHGMIGTSKPMKEMFRVLDRIAATDIPVVISGESGTGKELVARAIHRAGIRREKPFVAENCAAIPAALLESILFGHVRGAFTGAVRTRSGLFVEAHGGTLFLDEIADMPMEMQAKLLRVLQNGEVRPVGQNQSIRVDVRILVASNADLKKRVQQGTFREDLFYRLNVMDMKLPPLRERIEDVPILARFFVRKHAPDRDIAISADTMAQLMRYSWPGNVRQLENEIIRATVMCGDTMDIEHFSESVHQLPSVDADGGDADDLHLERHVNQLKIRLVRSALQQSGGNRSRAAELLGVSRFGLQKMMARLEIEV